MKQPPRLGETCIICGKWFPVGRKYTDATRPSMMSRKLTALATTCSEKCFQRELAGLMLVNRLYGGPAKGGKA